MNKDGKKEKTRGDVTALDRETFLKTWFFFFLPRIVRSHPLFLRLTLPSKTRRKLNGTKDTGLLFFLFSVFFKGVR